MADEQNYADIHCDQIGMMTTEWGVMLFLSAFLPPASYETLAEEGVTGPDVTVQLPAELKAVVRMSHSHAKTTVVLLKRMLKQFEQRSGEIIIPPRVREHNGITDEEWN